MKGKKINTNVSQELRQMILSIAAEMNEYSETIPDDIKLAYKKYYNVGDLDALEKVRAYMYDNTGFPEFYHRIK